MNLSDLLEEIFIDGIVEGAGTVFAVVLMMLVMFGGMLLPIIEVLVARAV